MIRAPFFRESKMDHTRTDHSPNTPPPNRKHRKPQAGAPNYFPNSFSGPAEDPSQALHRDVSAGDVARCVVDDDEWLGDLCV